MFENAINRKQSKQFRYFGLEEKYGEADDDDYKLNMSDIFSNKPTKNYSKHHLLNTSPKFNENRFKTSQTRSSNQFEATTYSPNTKYNQKSNPTMSNSYNLPRASYIKQQKLTKNTNDPFWDWHENFHASNEQTAKDYLTKNIKKSDAITIEKIINKIEKEIELGKQPTNTSEHTVKFNNSFNPLTKWSNPLNMDSSKMAIPRTSNETLNNTFNLNKRPHKFTKNRVEPSPIKLSLTDPSANLAGMAKEASSFSIKLSYDAPFDQTKSTNQSSHNYLGEIICQIIKFRKKQYFIC